ncbi:MAG TPA: hypothetical protein VMW50_13700 [Dehalococcoidia bacterium]|nr:hypothetical protein [Dehalococcoidia bacterium]
MTPKIKSLHADYLGMFLWFMFIWWFPLTRPYAIKWARLTLKRTRDLGYSAISYFMMCNAHFAPMIPWMRKKVDGTLQVQFDQPCDKWWEGLTQWYKLIKETGIDVNGEYHPAQIIEPIDCGFMARYNDWIFASIGGMYSPRAIEVQITFYRRMLILRHNILGANAPLRLLNEPPHDGSDATGHMVHDWHRDVYRGIQDLLPVKYIYVDVHNEYAKAPFCAKHKCPKCDRYLGGPEFLKNGKPQIVPEVHGCVLIGNLKQGDYDIVLNSPTWRQAGEKRSGDGMAGTLAYLCKGFAIKLNGRILWRAPNKEQYVEMLEYALSRAAEKGFPLRYGYFPLETLKFRTWISNWRKEPQWWREQLTDKKVFVKRDLLESYRPAAINWAIAEALAEVARKYQ